MTVFAAFTTSFVSTGGALRFARRRHLLALPNARSSHDVPTPSGGGLGITIGVTLVLPGALVVAGGVAVAPAVVPVVAACLGGVWDDIRPLLPLQKLSLLSLAALAILPLGTVHSLSLPYVGDVHPALFATPLTLVWLIAFTNAFNFMDGINGIASLAASVSGFVYGAAGVISGSAETALLGAVTAGVSLGFLPWNFPRARIFLGDAGSLPLGLLLAFTAVRATLPVGPELPCTLPFTASFLLFGPFLFDVAFTLMQRARAGERLMEAHREHLYQRLSRMWGSHAPVSLLYGGFFAVTGVAALCYPHLPDAGKLLCVFLSLLAMLTFAGLVLRKERRCEMQGHEGQWSSPGDVLDLRACTRSQG